MKENSKNPLTRFSNRVENYIKYRPGYPVEIIDFMKNDLNLDSTDTIADIGSGTGLFSELLLKNGNTVYGIEPNNEMRTAAENILQLYKNFISLNGTAERTTLKENSCDFITCAQAFHWFDLLKTKKEFSRILNNDGYVILIWNSRINDASDFMSAFENFLNKFSIDYQKVNHQIIGLETFGKFFNNFEVQYFPNEQVFDFEGLKGRVLSASYIPTEEDYRFSNMIEELRSLFDKFNEKGKIKMIYQTEVYFGRMS